MCTLYFSLMVIVGYLIVHSIVPFLKNSLVGGGGGGIVPTKIPLWGALFYCCKDPTTTTCPGVCVCELRGGGGEVGVTVNLI